MNAHLFLRRFRDLLKIVLTGRIFIELHEIKLKMNASTQNSNKIILTEKEQRTKISIVIPTLNESSYIKNSILSLKTSPYNNLEKTSSSIPHGPSILRWQHSLEFACSSLR